MPPFLVLTRMTIARLPLSCARTHGVVDVGRCVHRMVGNVEDDVSRRQTLFGSKPVGIYISDGNSLAICDGSERQAKRRWFLLLRLSCGLEWGDWKLSQPRRNGAFAAVAKNGEILTTVPGAIEPILAARSAPLVTGRPSTARTTSPGTTPASAAAPPGGLRPPKLPRPSVGQVRGQYQG